MLAVRTKAGQLLGQADLHLREAASEPPISADLLTLEHLLNEKGLLTKQFEEQVIHE